MVSKYIQATLMTVTISKPVIGGSCAFGAVYNKAKYQGNNRDCSGIKCQNCPFNTNNLSTLNDAINHE